MGCIWRIMPLLSTLAALVILVHSAEEDMDRNNRYDLRPRALDTGTPSYDQPWRAIEMEPMIQPSTQIQEWHDSPEEPPKRRRPVRKRKRRPLSDEEQIPQERHSITYPEESPRFHESDYNTAQTTEVPRRRRKKSEMRRNRWAEEYLENERPLRMRAQRRKRPSISPWSELSEFNMYRSDENQPEVARTEQNDPLFRHDDIIFKDGREHDLDDWFGNAREIKSEIPPPDASYPFIAATIDFKDDKMQMKEDKSLSEFSMEVLSPVKEVKNEEEDFTKLGHKLKEKSPLMHQFYKAQDRGPIDPLTLKDILKRSNGTSLSEILQQHNFSLADLLRGKEDAISVLKLENSLERGTRSFGNAQEPSEPEEKTKVKISEQENEGKENLEEKINLDSKILNDPISEKLVNPVIDKNNFTDTVIEIDGLEMQNGEKQAHNFKETLEVKENAPKIALKRRFPSAIRRKLRMKPMMNTTYKGQLNRDLMALTARRYLQHNSRNVSKSKEWKQVLPTMVNMSDNNEENSKDDVTEALPTTTNTSEESTTVVYNTEYINPTTISPITDTETESTINTEEIINTETTPLSTTTMVETTSTEVSFTDKPSTSRIARPTVNRMGLRRQAFNNRLKKKRLKQKNSTTEQPVEQDNFMKDLFGMPNLVSSSEFIARTHTPNSSQTRGPEDFTLLDDFITTEETQKPDNLIKSTRTSIDTSTTERTASTTEETAKFEIEEILNDTRTSARLSKILMERNMTLNELFEHRERGSSHVHLADIFHNASKEPNPPEPFLSKSLIEPISKETYPLRALLEANLHDPITKVTTLDPSQAPSQFVNIPVVMDFGNNVNENGENMGIMSLFNKFTENEVGIEKTTINKDSEGVPYVTTIINVTTNSSENNRDSRILKDDEDIMKQDIVNWNELFALIRKNNKNETQESSESFSTGLMPSESKKAILDEDTDGDGLIVLEDLQHLKDFDSNIASVSEEKLEINTYKRSDNPTREPGILSNAPSNTKSVTVATASIVGLTLILFLLTYAAFKWKQQRKLLSKKQSFCDERIPSPVFENRKGHKNNCSTRSISPMLASSNIYTLNTLDSHNGKESPDYMWDSLRKPFQ